MAFVKNNCVFLSDFSWILLAQLFQLDYFSDLITRKNRIVLQIQQQYYVYKWNFPKN